MKIVGIITEYNPFHNGHKYQIQKAKEIANADYVVVVMSGSFVQRGDAAICDKWSRAKMAICGGADLVIELPVVFSSQSAEFFAKGGVKLLEEIGANYIAFGVENDNLDELQKVADILKQNLNKEIMDSYLAKGESFPSARAKSLLEMGFKDILDTPNNILAIEYLKAITSDITPIPILRSGSFHDGIGSASYIRKMVMEGEDISSLVPKETVDILNKQIALGMAPNSLMSIESAIIARLRTISKEDLSQIRDVTEGLENRIKQYSNKFSNLSDILGNVKTKRYTHSRIRRIMLNTLLNITKDTESLTPEYIRVLAMNDKGKEILRQAKEKATLPIITKVANAPYSKMLDYDIMSTDVYSLLFSNPNKRTGSYDMLTSPLS